MRLKLGKVRRRLQETHRLALEYGDDLVSTVAARCTEVESGARNVDNILTNTLLPELSKLVLAGMAEGRRLRAIRVSVDAGGAFAYEPQEAGDGVSAPISLTATPAQPVTS